MASRRMKMKVAVNVTRSGRSGDRTVGRPSTPIPSVLSDNSSSSTGATHEVYPIQRSPVKQPVTQFSFPDRSNSPIAARFRTTSTSSVEDESHTFNEEEIAEIDLECESSETGSAFSEVSASLTSGTTGVSSLNNAELSHQRAPGSGTGAPVNTSTTTSILSNMKKEIGPIHVANLTSNETLKQRLQKGTSSTTTKYSILRKEFLTSVKNKVPEAKDLTILHFTFWNPPKSEDKEEDEEVLEDDFDMTRGDDFSCDSIMNMDEKPKQNIGPRVKVGPDGELIIDEQSLVVETSESQRAKKKLAEMKTIVGSNNNNNVFKNKKSLRRGNDWSIKETIKFYKALTMCGTDFSMMGHLFPKRTRGELKAKFKREDRKNSSLVSQALSAQTFDPNEPMTESEDELPQPPKRRRSSVKDKEKVNPPAEEQEEIICQSEEHKVKGKVSKPRKRRVSLPKGRPSTIDSSMKLPMEIIQNEKRNKSRPNKRVKQSKSLDSHEKIADRDIHISDNAVKDGVEIELEITPCC